MLPNTQAGAARPLLLALWLGAVAGCTNDYDRFTIGGGGGPGSTTDATTTVGSGGATTTTTGSVGGAAGTGGGSVTSGTGGALAGTGGAGGSVGTGGAGGGTVCTDVEGSCEPWWNAAWSQRRRIVVDNGGVTQDLTDFPVPIVLDASRIDYAATMANGQDVRFVAADGATVLDRDLEVWDPAGTSALWVKVPTVPTQGTGKVVLWMYYGNMGAPMPNNPKDAWSSGFESVHHLSGGFTDVTTGNNGSTPSAGATPSNATGRVGGAMNFDGSDDRIDLAGEADFDFTTSLTVSLWMRPDTLNKAWQAFVTKGDSAWRLHRDPNTVKLAFSTNHSGNPNDDLGGVGTITVSQWHHVAMTYDGAMKALYLDGALDAQKAFTQIISKNNYAVCIGENLQMTGRQYDGIIDEVRISNVPRSAAWLRFESAIVASNATLVTFSAEQTPP